MKLHARWALPVYPVFMDEKSKASDEKSVKRKNRIKKDQQDYYNCYKLRLRAINYYWFCLRFDGRGCFWLQSPPKSE